METPHVEKIDANHTVELSGATSQTVWYTPWILLNDTVANVKTIQYIPDQNDYKSTMERYVRPLEMRKRETVEKISSMLSITE